MATFKFPVIHCNILVRLLYQKAIQIIWTIQSLTIASNQNNYESCSDRKLFWEKYILHESI